jgi:hypothetical protein
MHENGDRAGRRQRLRDFLGDHAGFADSEQNHFAVATREKFDSAVDGGGLKTVRRVFDGSGFEP